MPKAGSAVAKDHRFAEPPPRGRQSNCELFRHGFLEGDRSQLRRTATNYVPPSGANAANSDLKVAVTTLVTKQPGHKELTATIAGSKDTTALPIDVVKQ